MIPIVKRDAETWRIGEIPVFISRCVVCGRAWKVAASARPSSTPEHRCVTRSVGYDEAKAARELFNLDTEEENYVEEG